MLTRRFLLASPVALAACAGAPADPAEALLARVIEAAGGRQALEQARVLSWTGSAVIHFGEQRIEIGVDTWVEPFVAARSETWPLAQGRGSARVLEITPEGGWGTRNGERAPLPEVQTVHERQQYALYGLMRLVTLRDAGASFTLSAPNALAVTHPSAPATTLVFDESARLIEARNTVTNPEAGGAAINQVFRFEGVIEGDGVRWPRRMTISQDGALFFELALDSFTPRQSR